jgi:hypothetical protein
VLGNDWPRTEGKCAIVVASPYPPLRDIGRIYFMPRFHALVVEINDNGIYANVSLTFWRALASRDGFR